MHKIQQNPLPCQVVYSGFDRVEVSFRCTVSKEFRQVLEELKNQVQADDNKEIALGKYNGVAFHIFGFGGGAGRYKYTIDTGYNTPLGEIIYIRNSDKIDWNLRVVVKSATLAENGFDKAVDQLYKKLEKLGCIIHQESLGRIDFCIDIHDNNFLLNPELFVAQAQATKTARGEFSTSLKGTKYSSLTIGKMPNTQLIIYDKSLEVIQKRKPFWWGIWGLRADKGDKVWRVEARLGKRALKEIWDCRTWQSLREKVGDMLNDILQKIRMVAANDNDSNVSRKELHEFWKLCLEKIRSCFVLYGHIRGQILPMSKEESKKIYKKLICGITAGLAYLEGFKDDDFSKIPDRISKIVSDFINDEDEKMRRLFDRASERFYQFQIA